MDNHLQVLCVVPFRQDPAEDGALIGCCIEVQNRDRVARVYGRKRRGRWLIAEGCPNGVGFCATSTKSLNLVAHVILCWRSGIGIPARGVIGFRYAQGRFPCRASVSCILQCWSSGVVAVLKRGGVDLRLALGRGTACKGSTSYEISFAAGGCDTGNVRINRDPRRRRAGCKACSRPAWEGICGNGGIGVLCLLQFVGL